MAILDHGEWTLIPPGFKAAISFADKEENLGLNINPGPWEWNILACLILKLHKTQCVCSPGFLWVGNSINLLLSWVFFFFWHTAKEAKMLICHSLRCEFKLFLQLFDNTFMCCCTCTCILVQVSTEHELWQVAKLSWRIIINQMAFSPSVLCFHCSYYGSLELFSRDSCGYLSMYQNNCTFKSGVK